MSSRSRISAQALHQSDQEMASLLLNFMIFKGGCVRPTRERVPNGGTNHPRDLEGGGGSLANL